MFSLLVNIVDDVRFAFGCKAADFSIGEAQCDRKGIGLFREERTHLFKTTMEHDAILPKSQTKKGHEEEGEKEREKFHCDSIARAHRETAVLMMREIDLLL